MSYDLQLRKGGLLITNEWDSEFADYLEQIVDDDEFLFHLHDSVCLDKNITIRDVFSLVSKNIDTFATAVGCPFLDDLVIEALSVKVISEEKEDMGHLELNRVAVSDNGNLFIYTDFSGKGIEETWAIEFSPANELIPYPIILNERVVIEDMEGEVLFKFKMHFTLLEFIKGIVDELSFVGPPDIKAFALNELKQRSDDITSENVKTYNHEELMKKLEIQKERYRLPCKICGKDARSSHFGKPSAICYKCFRKIKEN